MTETKMPRPDHPIRIAPAGGRTRARFKGHVIADSDSAVVVEEAGYQPACYFPREDVDMDYFARTERRSRCPYKGEASYFTLRMEGEIAQDAAWSYEDPYPSMDVLRDRIAFFPHPVEVYRMEDTTSDPSPNLSPDSVVRHTDAGDGVAQSDRWAPTVSNE